MIQFLRKLMYSKLGVGIAIAFVVVIALAFAAGDVSNYRSSSSGGDLVASIGKEPIQAVRLSQGAKIRPGVRTSSLGS